MSEKISFETEPNGYSPSEVDTYVRLLLDNYEDLLSHYEARQKEVETLAKELAETKASAKSDDYHEEALELLNETTKVVTQARAQARTKITALIDQASLHQRRLEDALQVMKDELDKLYANVEDQL